MLNEPVSLRYFWNLTADDALRLLSSRSTGLSSVEAETRLAVNPPLSSGATGERTAFFLLISQFRSPVTLLLIVASFLSAALGDLADTLIILLIVLISSLLGFWQEYHAAKAVAGLLKLVRLRSAVWRDGAARETNAQEVVPGDVIALSAGDIIPADCLTLNADALFVDEAAFTGETFPVEKRQGIVSAESPLYQRTNTLLMGSHVVSGKATAVAVRTGAGTAFGQISADLKRAAPETDFERGIRKFGYMLMELTLLLVLIIFAINVLLHKPVLNSLLFSLALAVGLTPQLLPAIISVNLASGAKRMAGLKVIVKRLSSIENLGSMNILCSDKTGTITEGKIQIQDALGINGSPNNKVLHYAWLNASLQSGYHNPVDEAICKHYQGPQGDYRVRSEIPYDFVRKCLSVQVEHGDECVAITKGALTQILAICSRAETQDGRVVALADCKEEIDQHYQNLSGQGLRTIGLAYKQLDQRSAFTREDEKDMVFLGFIVLLDPPKANIAETIGKLSRLGVGLKILTGDNALVTTTLATRIGFLQPEVLTGGEISKMSNTALLHRASKTDIFAELEPNQKERIIMMLKRSGNVVGFMGDGINDAPALHVAEVGISVDTAVDVAREAADIVLLSQDLEVLADGILEGRKTFTNTMKYIFMATSANFGNMFSMAGASLFLPFLPLLPKQILLTNILTDLPEMAIATDRVDQVNLQSPQRWDLHFIQRFMVIFGLLSSVFDYITFAVLLLALHASEETFQTGWFIESVFSATLIVLVVRTRLPFFKSLPGRYLLVATVVVLVVVLIIPVSPVAVWFGFSLLPLSYYIWITPVVVCYMLGAEITKQYFYRRVLQVSKQDQNHAKARK